MKKLILSLTVLLGVGAAADAHYPQQFRARIITQDYPVVQIQAFTAPAYYTQPLALGVQGGCGYGQNIQQLNVGGGYGVPLGIQGGYSYGVQQFRQQQFFQGHPQQFIDNRGLVRRILNW